MVRQGEIRTDQRKMDIGKGNCNIRKLCRSSTPLGAAYILNDYDGAGGLNFLNGQGNGIAAANI